VAAAKGKKAGTKTAKTTRSSAGQKATGKNKSAGNTSKSKETVTVNRRSGGDRRKNPDRRKKCVPVAVERRKIERRAKVNRRRQIDPTTCERDYSADEIEFMNALDEYKRASGRMFPTCSEILEVLLKLGYRKCPANEPVEPAGSATESRAAEAEGQVEQEPEPGRA
jgi:hypothetical protein